MPEKVVKKALPYIKDLNSSNGKVIVHFMQPHFPSIPEPITDQEAPDKPTYDGTEIRFAWNKLQEQEVTEERVRESFQKNLEYVLPYVEELVDEAEGRIVLSADHGQAFGEWGVYGHPPGKATRQVREVPWVIVQERATDRQENQKMNSSVEDKLAALGYK